MIDSAIALASMATKSGISLHLDEDVAKAIAQGVRRQQYHVVTTQEQV
jgi:hypothetical protein